MNERILNNIKSRITNFNKKYNLKLEINETCLEENKDMFGVVSFSTLTQNQSNELRKLFNDLGINSTGPAGLVESSTNNHKTYIWEFAVK